VPSHFSLQIFLFWLGIGRVAQISCERMPTRSTRRLASAGGAAGIYLLFKGASSGRVVEETSSTAFLGPAPLRAIGAGVPCWESQEAMPDGGWEVPRASHASGTAMASVLGGAFLAQATGRSARRAKKEQSQRVVARKLFGDLNQLNPFYETPEQQTKKRYAPQIEAVNALEASMSEKSDDELRALTKELQEKAQNGTSLDDLLPESFALVREASVRVLGLRPFDVQLMGGMALHEGRIAEMGTGEGKTLVAILPCFLNALTGKGATLVTVNDYLARRDAEWVGQPLRFLGMKVGVVQNGMTAELKKKAYLADVTYVTNSELGFDYLRDQMAASPSDLSLREKDPFNFAVVDEVDSILIDEARTPLIISGEAQSNPKKYLIANECAKSLRRDVHYTVDEKTRQCVLIEQGVQMAEGLLGKDDLFDPEDPWFPFVTNALVAKDIYVKDKAYIVKRGEVMIVDEFTGRVMEGRRWSNGLHQAVEAKESVQIQSESMTLASISYQSLFRLFNKLGGMTGTAFSEAKEFKDFYKLDTVVIPPNLSKKRVDKDDMVFVDDIGKWKAVAREVENAHRIGRPVLIGTTNVENSEIIAELLDTLGVPYQLLNAKPENVARETEIVASGGRKYSVTIATNMAGRGTDILLGGNSNMMARLRLREELYSKLFPKKSWAMPEEFYPIDLSKSIEAKVDEVVKKTVKAWMPTKTAKSMKAAEQMAEEGGGELTELDAEERLSLACEKAPTDDKVVLELREVYKDLNAYYKQVTDLEKSEVQACGGLLVLGTERHESRRIDNQLRGRCARQGDPGQTRFFLSLNDSIFRVFGGDSIKNMMNTFGLNQGDDVPLESSMLSNSLEEAQKKVENYFYSVRKGVFEYDDVMDTQRRIIYGLRRRALLEPDEAISDTMREFSDRNMEDFATGHIRATKPLEEWNLDKLAENVKIYCKLFEHITGDMLRERAGSGGPAGAAAITAFLQEEGQKAFEKKLESIEGQGAGLTAMVTRKVLLMQIDQFWQQHLKNMEFMKTSVTLRAYSQRNPLTEYKLEGYQVFLKMMSRIRRNALYNVFLFEPRKLTPMTAERMAELIPNEEQRKAELAEVMRSKEFQERSQQNSGFNENLEAAAKTMDLARLSINIRQVLEARESLGELALASFSELKESFARAGLYTLGDQLRWASVLTDLELVEDAVSSEIYIGLKGRAEPAPATAGSTGVKQKDFSTDEEERIAKRQAEAQKLFEDASADPQFMNSVTQLANSPDDFVGLMQASMPEGGWSKDEIEQMREQFKAVGIDIDQMLDEMTANADQLPAAQREVVFFMRRALRDPEGVRAEAKAKAEADLEAKKVDA